MRISNNMLCRNLLLNLTASQGKMEELQNQMSTGLRISKPSDDPAAIESVLRYKSGISMVDQWKENASDALQYMYTTDSTLSGLSSMLQRVRELAMQGANATNSVNERTAIAKEIQEINEQIVSIANTKVGSKYIFGGTNTDIQPIDAAGNWNGNSTGIMFDVGSNTKIDISVNGIDLFISSGLLTDTSTVPATPGILDSLNTALLAGDTAAISATLTDIDSNINNVLGIRSDLGARTNRVSTIETQLTSMSYNLTANLSNIEDVDMAKAITDFTNQQNIFQSALSVGAKIIQPSLVDFMS